MRPLGRTTTHVQRLPAGTREITVSIVGSSFSLPIRELPLGAAIVFTEGIAALGTAATSSDFTPHAR